MNFDIERHPLDEEGPSAVVISPHSELGKELLKWEQHPGPLGRNPGNPYVKREYPKMLYRAERHPDSGQPACIMGAPHPYDFRTAEEHDRAVMAQELWNRRHQRVVKDESEERIAVGQGWSKGPVEALEQFEKEQIAIAEIAGQVEFQGRRMSEKAQQELKAAHTETDAHIVDVQPKKRGRKPKAVTAAGPVEE